MFKVVPRLTAFILIALIATTAFAADASGASKVGLTLNQPTTIAGVKLAPGNYNLYVTRDGSNAKVRVTSGSKELVNTTAQFEEQSKFAGEIVLTTTATRDVVKLQSEKLKGALVFSADGGPTQGNSK